MYKRQPVDLVTVVLLFKKYDIGDIVGVDGEVSVSYTHLDVYKRQAYNAQVQLQKLESEYEILAFVDENCDEAQTKAVGRAIEQRDNVKECVFISKEEAIESFEEKYEGCLLYTSSCASAPLVST